MSIIIRPATQADHPAIRQMIRQARLIPLGLDWRRFLVADADGRIVATGQVKPHWDGSRELASIATAPEWQKQGIARQLIEALIARESGPIYLTCRAPLEGFYRRFGFAVPQPAELPTLFRLLNPMMRLGNGRIMKREAG